MKKMNAFTLAEVLITLGIIGVVAAMTMPTLMNSTQGAQYKAAYKKALSAISQGVTLNVALDGASFADAVAASAAGSTAAPATGDSVASILNSRMNIVKAATAADSGYGMTDDDTPASKFPSSIKVLTKDSANKNPGDEGYTATYTSIAPDTFLFFNDGSMFAYNYSDAAFCTQDTTITGHKECAGVIDVNGTKGPNKLVQCDGATTYDATVANCTVTNPTDIYPVVFYDQTILPGTDAARAVLYGK